MRAYLSLLQQFRHLWISSNFPLPCDNSNNVQNNFSASLILRFWPPAWPKSFVWQMSKNQLFRSFTMRNSYQLCCGRAKGFFGVGPGVKNPPRQQDLICFDLCLHSLYPRPSYDELWLCNSFLEGIPLISCSQKVVELWPPSTRYCNHEVGMR